MTNEWYDDKPMSPVRMWIKSAELAEEAGNMEAYWEFIQLIWDYNDSHEGDTK